VYIHSNGARYEGGWRNNLQHGYGIETWQDHSQYKGNYRNGLKDGYGEYVWPDGCEYKGDWLNNKITGKVSTYNNIGYIYMDGW